MTIYNIFWRLHLTSWKEKPSGLFFPDESYVQVEEKVMSWTFILSEVLWQSHLRYLKCSSGLQHCTAGLNVHLLDVIEVMFDSLIHRSFLKLLLCALIGILHMALSSTWFIGENFKFLDILLLNHHSTLFISSPQCPHLQLRGQFGHFDILKAAFCIEMLHVLTFLFSLKISNVFAWLSKG